MPFCSRWLAAFGLGLLSWPGAAQNFPARPPLPAISNLKILTRNSGYIFDGTVLSVERIAEATADSVAAVQITFRVEQAIRGTRRGQVLTIREWAGLWNSGERYRRGERLLLFLYSPGKLGLTSPVGGPLGRFAVDRKGNVVLEKGRLAALSLDSPSEIQLGKTNRPNSRAFALAIQHSAAQRWAKE